MSAGSSRVTLGMSGGVDSSTAAWKLKRDDCHVVGVTLLLVDGPEHAERVEHAAQVAEKLGIEHHVVDARELVQQELCAWYAERLEQGHQPDIAFRFTQNVLFPCLLKAADEHGCGQIATGHFAAVTREEGPHMLPVQLSAGLERARGQERSLAHLGPEVLERLRLPHADSRKSWVARDAMRAGIERMVRSAQDSVGPLLHEGCDLGSWAFSKVPAGQSGPIIGLSSHEELGTHEGLGRYAIGQGVELAAPEGWESTPVVAKPAPAVSKEYGSIEEESSVMHGAERRHNLEAALELERWLASERAERDAVEGIVPADGAAAFEDNSPVHDGMRTLYVVAKDEQRNALLVGPAAFSAVEMCRLRDVHWTSIETPEKKRPCRVQFVEGGNAYPAKAMAEADGNATIVFTGRVPGVCSGQTAVLYSDALVLGCGTVV